MIQSSSGTDCGYSIMANLLKGKDAKLQGLMFARTMTAWLPICPEYVGSIRYIRQLLSGSRLFFARMIFS